MSPRGPLEGIELLIIDGNNLLYRRRGTVGDAALRGLIPDLRRVLPDGVRAEVILDGHPEPGAPARERLGPWLEIRHAGGAADEAIVAAAAALPWASRGHTVVVTDDRALADRCRTGGALTRGLDWLQALPPAAAQSRPARPGSSIGAGRPPRRIRRDTR